MFVIRARFAKYNECAYISHLDLQRVMSRALRQSGVPVWYSNGFNPHIYMTFALPLSLTHESVCDAVDFKSEETAQRDWINKINDCLPNGIKIISIYNAATKPKDISFAVYSIRSRTGEKYFAEAVEQYNSLEKIKLIKKTKRSEKVINIKEYISKLNINPVTNELEVKLPAGETTISPTILVDYLESLKDMNKGDLSVIRTSILNNEKNEWI